MCNQNIIVAPPPTTSNKTTTMVEEPLSPSTTTTTSTTSASSAASAVTPVDMPLTIHTSSSRSLEIQTNNRTTTTTTTTTTSTAKSTLPKKKKQLLYFVRHAEAIHNIKEKEAVKQAILDGKQTKEEQEVARRAVLNDDTLRDAKLSTEGYGQTKLSNFQLSVVLKSQALQYTPPQIVLVSPLRRALMTATALFANEQPAPKFVAVEALREKRTGFACDERSPVHELKEEFPHVDFTDIDNGTTFIPAIGESNDQVRARGRQWILNCLPYITTTTNDDHDHNDDDDDDDSSSSASEEEEQEEQQQKHVDEDEDTNTTSPSIAIVSHKGWLRELRHTLKNMIQTDNLYVDFDIGNDFEKTLYGNAEIRIAEFIWKQEPKNDNDEHEEHPKYKLQSVISKSVDTAVANVLDASLSQEQRDFINFFISATPALNDCVVMKK